MVEETRSFRIVATLGQGGFGTVYQAELLGTGGFRKPVALKMLHEHAEKHEELLARLRDEARVVALLRHRAIVHVDGLIRLEGRWTVVMEYVDGVPLGALGAVPAGVALEILQEVADALDSAHTATDGGRPLNLVHRDIKPQNILLTCNGAVKLLDFGVARAEFEGREAQTNEISFGSATYMAPERWEREDTPAGDVYALGCVLAELVLGEPIGRCPLRPEKYSAWVDSVVARLPERIAGLARKLLAYEAGDRPTARQVLADCRSLRAGLADPWLRDWAGEAVARARGEPPRTDAMTGVTLAETRLDAAPARPRGWVVALAGAVGLVAVTSGFAGMAGLGWWLTRAPEPSVAPAVTPTASVAPVPIPAAADPAARSVPATPPKSPRTAAAKAPPPTAIAEAPTEPATGLVEIVGDAERVVLAADGRSHSAGPVPPGRYTLRARFSGRPEVDAGSVTVVAGGTHRVACQSRFALCKVD